MIDSIFTQNVFDNVQRDCAFQYDSNGEKIYCKKSRYAGSCDGGGVEGGMRGCRGGGWVERAWALEFNDSLQNVVHVKYDDGRFDDP